MAEYLDRIGAGKVLISKEPFSFDWTPPKLIGRDSQLGEIASMFMGIESSKISCRAVITGNVGSGKTVLSQRFGMDLVGKLEGRRRILMSHVNCRNHPTTSQVLQQIAISLDSGHPERGFSSGEMIQSIRRNLISRESHLLLILDEVDVLIRRDSSDLIYKLLRIDEGQSSQGTLSLILVSQENTLFSLFEKAIKSRLGNSNYVILPSYGTEELVGIARQRYEEACRPGSVSEEVLEKIGKIASDGGGDARLAIELLEESVRRAEKAGRDEVMIGDVEPSSLRPPSIEPSEIDGLGRHQKLVLLGICRRLKKAADIKSGDARKLYELVCEEFGEKPRGYTTFWKHIKQLETMGLIGTVATNSPQGRGRTQSISMSSSSPAVLESRIERELWRG